jgi:hypothetical protein
MPKTNPIIVTPEDAEVSRAHPEWLQDLKSDTADLWVTLDVLAARIAALEGHS